MCDQCSVVLRQAKRDPGFVADSLRFALATLLEFQRLVPVQVDRTDQDKIMLLKNLTTFTFDEASSPLATLLQPMLLSAMPPLLKGMLHLLDHDELDRVEVTWLNIPGTMDQGLDATLEQLDVVAVH